MTWLHGSLPRVIRHDWPQAPILFYNPKPIGLAARSTARKGRAVVREGHRFQEAALRSLVARGEDEGWFIFPEFVFEYQSGDRRTKQRAFIDMLAIHPMSGVVSVLEAKRSHTANSYKQIWKYMALCRSYFPKDFVVLGYELCLYQGLGCEYPGPHRWLAPGKLRAKEWSGRGLPEVSVAPFYAGDFWL